MKKSEPLPCPRLELRWEETSEDATFNWRCVYSIVIPLDKYDCRGETSNGEQKRELPVKISETRVGSLRGPFMSDGRISTPFRDGVHAQCDCTNLGGNIPIVAVCGELWQIVPRRIDGVLVNESAEV